MTVNLFMVLLSAFSVITGLIVQSLKNLLDGQNVKYSANILAIIVALIVGLAGTLTYYQLNSFPFSLNNIIYAILLSIASALSATLGYDKVVQTIDQINKK